MPIWAAGIGAGAGLAGSYLGFMGGQSTNAANLGIAQWETNSNAIQASVNRQWQTGQAQKQMDFQNRQAGLQFDRTKQLMSEQERYNTEMSNTAMQRRMADNRAAGVNPLLAIGAGGASSPAASAGGLSSPSGAMGGGAQGHAAGATMINPKASFSNLGETIANAAHLSTIVAESDKAKAEAQSADYDASYKRRQLAQRDEKGYGAPEGEADSKANAGRASAFASTTAEANAQAMWQSVKTGNAQEALQRAQAAVATGQASVITGTLQAVVRKALADAGIAENDKNSGQAIADLKSGPMGPAIALLETFGGPITSAVRSLTPSTIINKTIQLPKR